MKDCETEVVSLSCLRLNWKKSNSKYLVSFVILSTEKMTPPLLLAKDIAVFVDCLVLPKAGWTGASLIPKLPSISGNTSQWIWSPCTNKHVSCRSCFISRKWTVKEQRQVNDKEVKRFPPHGELMSHQAAVGVEMSDTGRYSHTSPSTTNGRWQLCLSISHITISWFSRCQPGFLPHFNSSNRLLVEKEGGK